MALLLLATGSLVSACNKKEHDHNSHSHSDPAAAHQDHSGKNGGLVQMFGDLHTEMVFDRGGKHRLYLSDATRQPLPASTVSDVRFTVKRPGADKEPLTLTATADYWIADGRPLDDPKTMVRLDFVYQGKKEFIDVPAMTLTAGH